MRTVDKEASIKVRGAWSEGADNNIKFIGLVEDENGTIYYTSATMWRLMETSMGTEQIRYLIQ